MLVGRLRIPNVIFKRGLQSNAELVEQCQSIRNRNPRNLERLRIGRKFAGYHLEKSSVSYWHKLFVTASNRFVSAKVVHFENGTVVSASTNEWALRLQLYRYIDTSAYINLGRLLAQRCLQSGICEMMTDPDLMKTNKVEMMLKVMEESGVILNEPERYFHPTPWDYKRPERSWENYE